MLLLSELFLQNFLLSILFMWTYNNPIKYKLPENMLNFILINIKWDPHSGREDRVTTVNKTGIVSGLKESYRVMKQMLNK